MFGNPDLRIEPKDLPRDVYYPAIRGFVHRDLLAKAEKDIEESETNLAEAKKELAEIKDKLNAANQPEPASPRGKANRAVVAAGAAEVPATDKELLDELRHAEDKVALAEKRAVAARADLPALEARIAADKAKYGTLSNADVDALAATALKKEREARILKAEADMLEARQELTEALLNPQSQAQASGREGRERKVRQERRQRKTTRRSSPTKNASKRRNQNFRRRSMPSRAPEKLTQLSARAILAQRPADVRHSPAGLRRKRILLPPAWPSITFGCGISGRVSSRRCSTLGQSGQAPSNPELLDWLAMEFMDSGWSMKHMHRLMVSSNTYQMRSSAPTESANREKDPDNIYLWRMNPRRMEAGSRTGFSAVSLWKTRIGHGR